MSDTPDRDTDPEPRTSRRRFPAGIATTASVVAFALLVLAVVVGLILQVVD